MADKIYSLQTKTLQARNNREEGTQKTKETRIKFHYFYIPSLSQTSLATMSVFNWRWTRGKIQTFGKRLNDFVLLKVFVFLEVSGWHFECVAPKGVG